MDLFPPPEHPAPPSPSAPSDDTWLTPPAPPRRRRALPIVLAVVLVAVLASGGAYWEFGRSSGPSYPKQWDPRVANLVSFVEQARGLTFKHPVKVEFLSEAAFKKQVSTSPESLSKKDREDLQNSVAFLRAIGLVNGNVDLLSSLNQSSTEGVLAYYEPSDKMIRIRGTNLDVATRVTLVHEMTHALQDQHFDLQKLQHRNNDDESGSITALIEGDATWVENSYIDSLSAADHKAYDKQTAAEDEKANFKGIPPVIQIEQSLPYELGPALVEVLRDSGGQSALDAAFVKPPSDEAQIFNPVKFVHHDAAAKVAKPTAPVGAKVFDSGTFDADGWFIMLSERIDAHEALRAADGWGGDAYISYHTADNRTCERTRFQGARAVDTAIMQNALTEWVRALPVKTASVQREGATLLFQSCDPGTKAKVATGRSLDAISLPISRVELLQVLLKDDIPLNASDCIANRVVDTSTIAELKDPSGAAFTSAAGRQKLTGIAAACRAQSG